MIFPWNVDQGNKGGNKSSTGEKIQFGVGIFVVVNIIIAVFMSSFLTGIGIPVWVGILIQLFIVSIIAIFFLRFFVLKEDERMQEYNSGESFVKYYKFRKDSVEEYTSYGRKVLAYEYDNGTCTFIMEMKYGSNDKKKEKNTRDVLEQILKVIYSNRLEVRTIVMPEDFLAGQEAKRMMEVVNKAKGTKIGKYNLKLVDGVLEHTKDSNLESLYIMVKTTAIYQKYELDTVLNSILSLILSSSTCFREVNFLDKDGLVHLMKRFYGVEAIDLSMVKAVESSENTVALYQEMVSLYQINSVEGKSFTKPLPEKKTNAIKM